MSSLTHLDDALALIVANAPRITARETVSVRDSVSRVTAAAVTANVDLPRFTNTGVDGYAIIHDASVKEWPIIGASYAGAPFTGIVASGQAVRIATGAVLPEGADTVVMQEDCTVDGNRLTIVSLPQKGAAIRLKGADIAQGDEAIAQGRWIGPQDMALLGALNTTEVSVYRPVRIAVLSSGAELSAGADIAHGQVIDSNSAMIQKMLAGPSVRVDVLPALPDRYDDTAQALNDAAKAYDIVVTTGGVSVGDHDHIRDALHTIAKPVFWKLALRPGKPVLVARAGDCLFAGLPGNPVSAFVTTLLIVKPMIEAMYGMKAALPPAYKMRLAGPVSKPAHLRVFARADLQNGGLRPYPDQSSNLYTSLTHADGLLDLPVGTTDYEAGDEVDFRPLRSWL